MFMKSNIVDMKAPDKIYIQPNAHDRWFDGNKPNDIFVEYIRKDALVEKLEKAAAEYKKRSDEGELVWQNMCGINEAIDILNKM